jgi:hypothetical protein
MAWKNIEKIIRKALSIENPKRRMTIVEKYEYLHLKAKSNNNDLKILFVLMTGWSLAGMLSLLDYICPTCTNSIFPFPLSVMLSGAQLMALSIFGIEVNNYVVKKAEKRVQESRSARKIDRNWREINTRRKNVKKAVKR